MKLTREQRYELIKELAGTDTIVLNLRIHEDHIIENGEGMLMQWNHFDGKVGDMFNELMKNYAIFTVDIKKQKVIHHLSSEDREKLQ